MAQDNNRITKEGKKNNKNRNGKKMWILEKVIKVSKLKHKAGVSKKFGLPISNKDILLKASKVLLLLKMVNAENSSKCPS